MRSKLAPWIPFTMLLAPSPTSHFFSEVPPTLVFSSPGPFSLCARQVHLRRSRPKIYRTGVRAFCVPVCFRCQFAGSVPSFPCVVDVLITHTHTHPYPSPLFRADNVCFDIHVSIERSCLFVQICYTCKTCGLTDDSLCCEICVRVCHAGHNVSKSGALVLCQCESLVWTWGGSSWFLTFSSVTLVSFPGISSQMYRGPLQLCRIQLDLKLLRLS